MDMTLPPETPWFSIGMLLFIAVVWVGPIGLFVLRKRLANATGARLAAKVALGALTALTAPAAAIMVLIVVAGFSEAVAEVWSLLRNAW